MPAWLRRAHRWLGAVAALFVLLLSTTGVLLNHSADWQLDRRFVSWSWLLAAYGIEAPAPSGNFADRAHRATLLGQRLYFDEHEIARNSDALIGMVTLGPLAVVAIRDHVLVLTTAGDLVQRIDVSGRLAGPIDRIGRRGDFAVIASGSKRYRSDADVTGFEPWPNGDDADVAWSAPSAPSDEQLALLQGKYRGEGLTLERLLADLHSGRIVSVAGPLFMDFIALCLIMLSTTGIILWVRGSRSENRGRRKGSDPIR